MEYWGIEVKPGETVKVNPGEEKILHLSQASIGDLKNDKGTENVSVFLEVDSKKLVIGTLSLDKFPQISYDLIFEKEFGLSHGSKSFSVYFLGYKAAVSDGPNLSGYEFESEEEAEIALASKVEKNNGKPEKKEEPARPQAGKSTTAAKADVNAAVKSKAKVVIESGKTGKGKLAEDDDDDEDHDSDEDIPLAGEDDKDEDSDDDEDDKEDEETPKPAAGKKRSTERVVKTPVPEKKAKLVSPASNQKGGDGKKGGAHVATPYLAKQAGKAPSNDDKSKQKTPKSIGTITCPSCPNKRFATESALQSHNKAKHEK